MKFSHAKWEKMDFEILKCFVERTGGRVPCRKKVEYTTMCNCCRGAAARPTRCYVRGVVHSLLKPRPIACMVAYQCQEDMTGIAYSNRKYGGSWST